MGPYLAADRPDPYLGREDLSAQLARLAATGATGGCPRVQLIHAVGNGGTAVGVAFIWSDEWSIDPVFTDGRVYLSATDPATNAPVPAEELQAAALVQLGFEGDLPTGPHLIDAKYQQVTRNKKLLVVLDNATGATNVEPLVPHSAQAMVVVVAHRRLPLGAFRVVDVPPLAQEPARALLACLLEKIGADAARLDEATVADLLDVCGGNPAMIHIVAGAIGQDPGYAPRLLADLRARGLEAFRAEGGDGMIAALDLAYDGLPEAEQRAYRLLALLPGPEFPLDAAIAALGDASAEAGRAVHGLVRYNLIQPTGEPDRYRFHLPVRRHAAGLVDREPAEARQNAAIAGIEWYRRVLVTELLHATDRWQVREEEWRGTGIVVSGPVSEQRRVAAVHRLRAERANLEAAILLASGAAEQSALTASMPQAVVDLCFALWVPHHRDVPRAAALDLWPRAVAAARALGWPAAEMQLVLQYGGLLLAAGHLAEARRQLEHGLRLAAELRREQDGPAEQGWLGEQDHQEGHGRQDEQRRQEGQGRREGQGRQDEQRRQEERRRLGEYARQGEQSALDWLGKLARAEGDLAGAIRLFDESMAIPVPAKERDRTRALLSLQIARTRFDLGQYDAAGAAATLAAAHFAPGIDTDNQAKCGYEQGRALLAGGAAAPAVEVLRSAAERFESDRSIRAAAVAWQTLAEAHRVLGERAAEDAALTAARACHGRLYDEDDVAAIDRRRAELASGR